MNTTYEERLTTELVELTSKTKKLREFLKDTSRASPELTEEGLLLLKEQNLIMMSYVLILKRRIFAINQ